MTCLLNIIFHAFFLTGIENDERTMSFIVRHNKQGDVVEILAQSHTEFDHMDGRVDKIDAEWIKENCEVDLLESRDAYQDALPF